jgi:hypothetical protein
MDGCESRLSSVEFVPAHKRPDANLDGRRPLLPLNAATATGYLPQRIYSGHDRGTPRLSACGRVLLPCPRQAISPVWVQVRSGGRAISTPSDVLNRPVLVWWSGAEAFLAPRPTANPRLLLLDQLGSHSHGSYTSRAAWRHDVN